MNNKLEVFLDFRTERYHVGTLLYSEKMNRHYFEYSDEFLKTKYEISPLAMPKEKTTYESEYINDFYGIHGVFADSLPDAWGIQIQDIEFEKIGILEPTPLQRLAFINKYSMGALTYEPAENFAHATNILKISDLRKAVQGVIKGDVNDVADELLLCGGSAGGARPKFLLELNGENFSDVRYPSNEFDAKYFPILMKIPVSNDDLWQRMEYTYCKMGKLAGINLPETFLISGTKSKLAHFATRRFDIGQGGERVHCLTFAALLNKPFRYQKHDYSTLLKATEIITKDATQVIEIYRRMVFNYLGCNRDDHAKNFSFCMDKTGDWKISPAYDIGFSKGQFNHNAMSILHKTINPTRKDFETIAKEFRIKKWKEIIEEVSVALNQFENLAHETNIRDTVIRRIKSQIDENLRRVVYK